MTYYIIKVENEGWGGQYYSEEAGLNGELAFIFYNYSFARDKALELASRHDVVTIHTLDVKKITRLNIVEEEETL